MSLLDSFPHECTIGRISRSSDPMGGSIGGITIERTDVVCWQQRLTYIEVAEFQKRGIAASSKIYFTDNPRVTEQHRILITKDHGVVVANSEDILDPANPNTMDVAMYSFPDASAGSGTVWKVVAKINSDS